MARKIKALSLAIVILLMGIGVSSIMVSAAEPQISIFDGHTLKTNTGKDNGYSGNNKIGIDDPHYGWEIGDFKVTGFTSTAKDEYGDIVFLKNLNDEIELKFFLNQNIEALNGNDNLKISDDKNTYDEYFETKKTDFGRGALIVRKTDYQGNKDVPTIYKDFLSAKVVGADTTIDLYEEGDYEVALDYEIVEGSIIKSYENYRVFFKFSVRNGNCMVYPNDIKTGAELSNGSYTENGFSLNLADSRYLTIGIKRDIMSSNGNGLENFRFNRPASDGEQYTEEGIYTFTVYNLYTKESTTVKIYVGKNNIMKAHLRYGIPISEINERVKNGAKISNSGVITDPPPTTTTVTTTTVTTTTTPEPTTTTAVTTTSIPTTTPPQTTTPDAVPVIATGVEIASEPAPSNAPIFIGITGGAVGLGGIGFGLYEFYKRRQK
jgi:hypothetical protein